MGNRAGGFSVTMFIAGIVIAILASSALSTVIVTQFAVVPLGPAGGFDSPDYDSGWVTLPTGMLKTFTHNLVTTDILVYLYGRGVYDTDWIYHQIYYGGVIYESSAFGDNHQGVYWQTSDENTITVKRNNQDVHWDECRVLIWKIS